MLADPLDSFIDRLVVLFLVADAGADGITLLDFLHRVRGKAGRPLIAARKLIEKRVIRLDKSGGKPRLVL